VNENTTNGARRAEDILPGGFVPSHLAKPMLRAASTTQLEYVAEGLLDISVASALLSGPIEDAANRHKLADDIHTESRRLYRLVKALAAGALGLAVLAGVVLSPAGGSTAQAAEAPEPDPVAAVSAPATVRVTLGAAGATARIRVTTPTHDAARPSLRVRVVPCELPGPRLLPVRHVHRPGRPGPVHAPGAQHPGGHR
jgi:hypothetical protein